MIFGAVEVEFVNFVVVPIGKGKMGGTPVVRDADETSSAPRGD